MTGGESLVLGAKVPRRAQEVQSLSGGPYIKKCLAGDVGIDIGSINAFCATSEKPLLNIIVQPLIPYFYVAPRGMLDFKRHRGEHPGCGGSVRYNEPPVLLCADRGAFCLCHNLFSTPWIVLHVILQHCGSIVV